MKLTAWNVRRANKYGVCVCVWVVDLSLSSCAHKIPSESVNIRNLQIDGIFSHLILIFWYMYYRHHHHLLWCASVLQRSVLHCYRISLSNISNIYISEQRNPDAECRRVNYTRWCVANTISIFYISISVGNARVPEIFRGRYVYLYIWL